MKKILIISICLNIIISVVLLYVLFPRKPISNEKQLINDCIRFLTLAENKDFEYDEYIDYMTCLANEKKLTPEIFDNALGFLYELKRYVVFNKNNRGSKTIKDIVDDEMAIMNCLLNRMSCRAKVEGFISDAEFDDFSLQIKKYEILNSTLLFYLAQLNISKMRQIRQEPIVKKAWNEIVEQLWIIDIYKAIMEEDQEKIDAFIAENKDKSYLDALNDNDIYILDDEKYFKKKIISFLLRVEWDEDEEDDD